MFEKKSNLDDHSPIIRLKQSVVTDHGGYEIWQCGCICGWLYQLEGRYIPSCSSATLIYYRHVFRETGIRLDESEDFDEEVFYTQLVLFEEIS